MRFTVRVALALVLFAIPARGKTQTLRPLITEDAATLPDRALEMSFAVEWLRSFQSPTQAVRGPLLRLPILGINYGVGDRVELQLRAPLRQRFSPDDGMEGVRAATGDATIATKFRLFGGGIVPALATRALIKLPNISESSGIGTDETDVTLELLASVDLAGVRVVASVGVAILGDTEVPSSQNDKLTYGFGALIPLGLFELAADVHGLRFGDAGAADEWSALAGLASRVGPVRFDASAGVLSQSGHRSLQLAAGATLEFHL